LTPAYSKGSLRSNSISGRSSSVVATRDGLVISTFQQHQQAFELRKKTRWQSLLVTLWLMSAQTFLRAGRLDEVNKAIGEAEQLGLGDPGVWHQLGQLSLKVQEFIKQKKTITPSDLKVIKEMSHVSIDAFEKALTLDPEHIPSQVAKATRLIELDEWELAEGLLEEITLGLGWDSAQAWYQQAQVMQHYQDLEQTKACLLYSLELFDTEPIRSFSVLPRFI
jgi:tetratricopeptide (TPR) repeat protein